MKESRLFHYLAGIWLAVILSFAAIAYWADRTSLVYHEELFNEQQFTQVSLARRGLENHLNQVVDYIVDVSEHLAIEGDGPVSQVNFRHIDRLLGRSEILAVQTVGTSTEGQTVLLRSSPETETLLRTSLDTVESALSGKESEGTIQFTELFLTPESQLLGLAVRYQSEGWLLAVIDLNALLELYVAPMRFGKFGAGYALDGHGHIVYDHEFEIIGRSVFDGMHDKYPALLELDRQMVTEDSGKSEYTFTVQRGGPESRKLLAWDTVLMGDQRLVVALSAPDIEIDASLGDRRQILLAAAMTLFLVLGGTTLLFVRLRQRILTQANIDLAHTVDDRTQALNRELRARTESEGKVRDFAEISSDWFWETDKDFRFNALIRTHESAIRLEMETVEGLRREEVTCEDTNTEKWRQHQEDLENHQTFRDFRYKVLWEDGTEHTMSTSGKPIFDENREFLGYRGTGTDITGEIAANRARDQALEEANRANQTKSRFLATMSHELRTPLNAIMGFSDVLAHQYFGPPGAGKYKEYAKDIHTSASYLLELVNDLLDMARIEAGKMVLNKRDVDLAHLIDECVQSISERAEKLEIGLRKTFPTDLPHLIADPRAVKQVLLNLLSNALKYSKPGGEIHVSTRAEGDLIHIHIRDTGIGIPDTKLSLIQEPFERGHDDPYETSEGWGLGLSIANALVVAHDGHLNIDSVEGEWTEVTVTLPCPGPDAAHEKGDGAAGRSSSPQSASGQRLRH